MKLLLHTFILVAVLIVWNLGTSYGQSIKRLSSYTPSQPEVSATHSVILDPGFYVPSGSVFRAFITPQSANCQPLASTPSADQNYIVTYIPRQAFNEADDLDSKETCEVMQQVQYFDGMGRLVQTVQTKASPQGRDIVLPVEYDPYGREVKKYLPYAAASSVSNGSYKPSALTELASFYNNPTVQNAPAVVQTDFPYSPINYESSPLSRVLQEGAPGAAWQLNGTAGATDAGHTVKTSYGTNGTSEVRLWTAAASSASAGSNYYEPGTLYKTVTTDENGNNSIEYKDKQGLVIMTSVQSGTNTYLSTYYVYDDYRNLCFVIPPGVTVSSFNYDTGEFVNFIYAYKYDAYNRVIAKKIPGKDWERMVYNKLDQLVLIQDGVQKPLNKWNFTKYDAQGRVILTGEITDTRSRDLLIPIVENQSNDWEQPSNAAGNTEGYTNLSFPSSWDKLYTVNYYDNYTFPGIPYTHSRPEVVTSERPKGLPTGSKVRDLETGTMLWKVNYYDDYARLKELVVQNHIGGEDRIFNEYSFTNQLEKSDRTHHSTTVSSLNIINEYKYDHADRKSEAWQKTGTGTNVMLSKLEYNEVGQLKEKKLHSVNGADFIESISYSYNPRGWLNSINTPSGHFTEQLYYETATLAGALPNYNGNITEAWYSSPMAANKRFLYQYDMLNRLTHSKYYTGSTYTGQLDETIAYNNMGNITSLVRGDAGNLGYYYTGTFTYTYTGNRTSAVKYNGNTYRTYTYDLNGNATGNAYQTWTYNHLNLPNQVSLTGVNLNYGYTAAGEKIRLRKNNVIQADYVSGIQYKGSGVIDFIQTEEGRYEYAAGTYQYNLKDHLGNVRASVAAASATSATVLQEDEYYAFGLNVNRKDVSSGNRYLYNGKELQPDMALGVYDYGARFYDPVVARWSTVDPLAEKYFPTGPYSYVENNPIVFTDPFGMDKSSTHTDKYGNVLAVYDDGDLGVYKHKSAKTKADVDKKYNTDNTSAGGVKMGETWTSLGFADFDVYEQTGTIKVKMGAKIDFNSKWATDEVNNILNENPSALEYALKAGQGNVWDIKAHSPNGQYYGSLLFGKYASARDAGNFAAGAVAANSYFPGLMLDYGLGAYSRANNNSLNAAINSGKLLMNTPLGSLSSFYGVAKYGEFKLSQVGIDAGKAYINNILNKQGGFRNYLKKF